MEAKKISFGFSKVAKKTFIIPSNSVKKDEKPNKIELITCLEGQEIKLLENKPEEKPLVIPMQFNQQTSAAIASLVKRRAVLLGDDEDIEEDPPTADDPKNLENTSNSEIESLEARAARELMTEAKGNQNETLNNKNFVVPVVHPDDLPLDGATESTIDDYENVPIKQFGLAMLRGMGWKDPPPKTNKKSSSIDDDTPFLRPKGMGLGADKALKPKPLLVAPDKNEKLEIKKGACVRLLAGHHKDAYGKIEGFDDHAGRIIVKLAIGGNREIFNEFLCQPVSKNEYEKYGKCINSVKYEAYKKLENEHGQIILTSADEEQMLKKPLVKAEDNIKKENFETFVESRHFKVEGKPFKKEYDDEHKYHNDTKRYSNIKEEKDYKSYKNDDCKKEHRNTHYDEGHRSMTIASHSKAENGKSQDMEKYRQHNRRDRQVGRDCSRSHSSQQYKNRDYKIECKNSDGYRHREAASGSNEHMSRDSSSNRDVDRQGFQSESRGYNDSDSSKDNDSSASEAASNACASSSSSVDKPKKSHKKKSKKNKKLIEKKKKSSKKHKNSSTKKYADSSSEDDDSAEETDDSAHRSRSHHHHSKKEHKKKSKKSRRQRSRSSTKGRR